MRSRTFRYVFPVAAAACALAAAFAVVHLACNDADPDVDDDRPRAGDLDVTFFVAADTHFGYSGMAKANKRQIDCMNSLPGKPYPPAIGGRVGRPLGVLIAGDLTDGGRKEEWREFVRLYGRTGRDGLLKYPIYEGTGNHDRWPSGSSTVITEKVRARRGSLHYTWNWGDLHLFCLDEAPTWEGLKWLKRKLAHVGRDLPIVIYFHFPLSGPYSGSNWFGKGLQKPYFGKLVQGYNVIGIFHGHYHGTGHYKWQGFDVYNVGSPKHAARSFAVVHVTDTRLDVAEWDWNWWRNGWVWHHSKRINARSRAPTRPTSPTAASAPRRGRASSAQTYVLSASETESPRTAVRGL